MAVVVIVALDLAALRAALPRLPSPGLMVMVIILEAGLFHVFSRRGRLRPFRLGFQAGGWSYVILGLSPLRVVVFRWLAWIYERFLGLSLLGSSLDQMKILVVDMGVQLLLAISAGLLGGLLARLISRRVGPAAPASDRAGLQPAGD